VNILSKGAGDKVMSQLEKRILCVDDDVESCKFLEFMLSTSNEKYTVVSAHSSKEAVELIENEMFDLYILDNWMIDLSGVQLCSLIRFLDKQTPILFFSGATKQTYRDEAIRAGANEYLIKPNDLGRIEDTVHSLLK
jgi:DNA-binding response OmpR family regulator